MPYPGGKHGPGHYIPSAGGPVSARVEVGSVIVAPQINTVLPPANEAAGDRIFAYVSNGTLLVDGTWTQLATAPTSFTVHTKVAAGDITDIATIAGALGNEISVGVKFTMKDIAGPGSWDFNAQSSLRNTLRTAFDCNSLPTFSAKPSISFFAGVRIATGLSGASVGAFSDPAFTALPDGGIIVRVTTQKTIPATSTNWSACNWNFQPVATAYPTGLFWSGASSGSNLLTQTRGFRYDHD